jgi:hypothetical protein
MSPTTTATNGTRRMTPSSVLPTISSPLRSGGRNRSRVAAGLLLILVTTLGVLVLFSKAGDRQAVLAVAQTVEVGEVVDARDLRVVHVSADPGVRAIPATQRQQVVGRTAAVRLVPGSLLASGQLGDGVAVPAGHAMVGAVLKPGQYPIGLTVGDRVALVFGAASGAGIVVSAESAGAPPTATVAALGDPADATGGLTVSLVVPADAAPGLASAGAAGRLNLVVLGQ